MGQGTRESLSSPALPRINWHPRGLGWMSSTCRPGLGEGWEISDTKRTSPPGNCVSGNVLQAWLTSNGLQAFLETNQSLWRCVLQEKLGYLLSCCSVVQSRLTLCKPMNCSMPGVPVLHYHPEFAQIHVLWVGDAIKPSHPLLSPSPPALNLSQHQGLFQWVSSLNQVTKGLAPQLQHQSFQRIFRDDFF